MACEAARDRQCLNLNHAARIRWRSGERDAIFAHGDHKPCDHPFGREAPVDLSAGASHFSLATTLRPSAGSGARRRHDEGGTPTIFLKARLNAASEP